MISEIESSEWIFLNIFSVLPIFGRVAILNPGDFEVGRRGSVGEQRYVAQVSSHPILIRIV